MSVFTKVRDGRANEFLTAADLNAMLSRNIENLYHGRAARVRRATETDVGNSSYQTLPYEAAIFDSGLWDVGDSRLRMDREGMWIGGLCNELDANATGTRVARILLNGGLRIGHAGTYINSSVVANVAAGWGSYYALPREEIDYIEGQAWQNTGDSLDAPVRREYAPELWLAQLSAARSAETWTAPRTWLTTDSITPALWNTHVRDNLKFLRSRPACRVMRMIGQQSIPNNTFTTIDSYDSVWGDPYGMFAAGTNNRITIQRTGIYLIIGLISLDALAGGWRRGRLRLNGGTTLCEHDGMVGTTAQGSTICMAALRSLTAADYVQMDCEQTQGGAVDSLARRYSVPQLMAIHLSDTATPPTFTNPKTWAPLDALTAADLNTYVRDNLLFLYGPPAVRALRTTAQSINDSTWTAIAYNAADNFDNDAMHDTVTNNTRVKFNRPGLYLVVTIGGFAPSSAGVRGIRIRKNGDNTKVLAMSMPLRGDASRTTTMCLVTVARFNAADYVETQTLQTSGGVLNSGGAVQDLAAVRIGA